MSIRPGLAVSRRATYTKAWDSNMIASTLTAILARSLAEYPVVFLLKHVWKRILRRIGLASS